MSKIGLVVEMEPMPEHCDTFIALMKAHAETCLKIGDRRL